MPSVVHVVPAANSMFAIGSAMKIVSPLGIASSKDHSLLVVTSWRTGRSLYRPFLLEADVRDGVRRQRIFAD